MEISFERSNIELMTQAETTQTPPLLRSDTEQRIIEAARELFMAHGFSGVSGDLLCKTARVSKTSLYKYFGDMMGVFQAVVIAEGQMFDLSVDTEPEDEAAFWQALVGYGTRLLRLLNRPFCQQLDRMIHEEARQNRGLAEAFYENAYGKGHADVLALIKHGMDRGYISTDWSASDIADHLVSMWEGLPLVRTRLGLLAKPFPHPKKRVVNCIELLLRVDLSQWV